ncbi:HIV Tat-specific factor 1 [Contarinia nasturtii]|uniref:HIV Tat-specific factor 1 n=1 Tax=Contarinia nasturtii TaxID=265458 RepID=UPI0012D44356|nr:HIV Tat-specific factor 1 [Contarinia nasturtii]
MSDALSQVETKGEVIPENGLNEPKNSANISTESEANHNNDSNKSALNDTAGSYADYEKFITYGEDGMAIYTNPATNYQYVFDKEKNQWVPKDSETSASNPYETEHYRWCTKTKEWILKDGASEQEENPYVNEHYKWNPETNKWDAKNGDQRFATSVFVDGQHLYTDADGTVFFWDDEKKAWFPKIDDDFMAIYQTNYGFIDNTSTKETTPSSGHVEETKAATSAAITTDQSEKDQSTGKRKANQPQWFDESPDQCTKVYVSDLPDDITEDEFAEVMSKCGMIFRDPKTKKLKIKLYAEPSGQLKGDGLVHYIRVESVKLAIDMLDGYEVRGRKIKVQRAQFQMRGEYNPALKPKRKKQDKEKVKKLQDKLLDWRPDRMRGERGKHERVVILKNLFEPEIFHNHVDLIIEYKNDLRDECSKCGTVKKVVIYSGEAEGVAEVRMSDPEEADLVVQMMHRRYFGKRMLSAELWDGKTKFKANETEDELKERLSKWDEFLEADDNDNKSTPTETTTTETTTAETKTD